MTHSSWCLEHHSLEGTSLPTPHPIHPIRQVSVPCLGKPCAPVKLVSGRHSRCTHRCVAHVGLGTAVSGRALVLVVEGGGHALAVRAALGAPRAAEARVLRAVPATINHTEHVSCRCCQVWVFSALHVLGIGGGPHNHEGQHTHAHRRMNRSDLPGKVNLVVVQPYRPHHAASLRDLRHHLVRVHIPRASGQRNVPSEVSNGRTRPAAHSNCFFLGARVLHACRPPTSKDPEP